MIDLFTQLPTDRSIDYLRQIFGTVGNVLTNAPSGMILPQMFGVFNKAVLVLGTVIVSYTTIVGVLLTAAEGEFLGKHWKSLWVPLRMVFGIAGLIPTASGYCAIQVIVMWFIIQGVGAANTVWGSVVSYLQVAGNIRPPSEQTVLQDQDIGGKLPTTFQTLFSDLVCQSMVNKISKNDKNATTPYPLNETTTNTYYFSSSSPTNTTSPECGSISWATTPEAQAAAQTTVMKQIVPTMGAIADYYVNLIINDRSCWFDYAEDDPNQTSCKKTPQEFGPPINTCKYFSLYSRINPECPWLNDTTARDTYAQLKTLSGTNFIKDSTDYFYGFANQYLSETQGTETTVTESALKSAQDNGWIFAGAYYYMIASRKNTLSEAYNAFIAAVHAEPNIAVTSDNIFGKNPFIAGSPDDQSNTMLSVASSIVLEAEAEATDSVVSAGRITIARPSNDIPKRARSYMNWANQYSSQLLRQFINNMTGTGDPLVSLHAFGHYLLALADIVFIAFFAVGIGLGFLSWVLVLMGTSTNPFQGVSTFIQTYLTPVAILFIVYCIVIGGLLGIYLPLLPYILYSFGVVGWFIAVVEALVAAPVVAIGILSPGGQHEILGRAEQAGMHLLNIFFRPTLMIFGMITGMLIAYVVMKFINAAFYSVVESITKTMGFVEGFLYIMAYVGIVVTALNKSYSLIYHLPDRVLGWIGQAGPGYGEEAAAEKVHGKVEAGAGAFDQKTVGGAMEGSATAGGAFLEKADKKLEARAEAKKKLGLGGQPPGGSEPPE